MPSIPQVIVSETRPNTSVDGLLLGDYFTDFVPSDQKIEFTSNTTHLRGRWITIVKAAPNPHSSQRHSLMMAEVRVYGGKCMYTFNPDEMQTTFDRHFLSFQYFSTFNSFNIF